MLRVDKNAEIVLVPWSLTSVFTGRYAIQCGRRVFAARWKRDAITAIDAAQRDNPVQMLRYRKRTLWHFHDRFYWDDDGLESDDVKALALERERRTEQKLRSAHSLMRAEQAGRPTRVGISSEVKAVVFERDGGQCVECGSNFNLQFDHVLPVSLGGATTVENLQVLCADCNRRKSNHF